MSSDACLEEVKKFIRTEISALESLLQTIGTERAKGKLQLQKQEKAGRDDELSVHRTTSKELRAGVLYIGCACEKRDGLQDQCPRTGCHGSPECLTSPPTCAPSKFSSAKHLQAKIKRRARAAAAFKLV